MRGPKLKIMRDPAAPVLVGFTRPGDGPTGGTRVYAPAKMLKYPLTRIEGPGVVTGQYMLDQGPQLRTIFAPFIAPIQGGGVVSGQNVHNPLTDPYDDAAPDIQGGDDGSRAYD